MRTIAMLVAAAALAGPVGIFAYGLPLPISSQQDAFTTLEAEAIRALNVDTGSFASGATLVDRLQSAAERAPTVAQRGRLALLWLRSVRWLLASVPFDGAEQPPYRNWLTEHESLVIYSDPAGEWLLAPDMIWKVHDAHRSAAAADDIAWFAVRNGYPGECEGYVPCYANILNWLEGEYLRRHPQGQHASEAMSFVRSSLEQALKLLAEPGAISYLNPATDCGDLKAGLEPLRQAVMSVSDVNRSEVTSLIDRLLSRCQ